MVRRRILIAAVLVLAALALAGFALMLGARGPLIEARAAMQQGRRALLSGEAASAARAFREARVSFDDAEDRLSNPLTWFTSVLPVIGRTPDAVRAGAEAGALTAEAGTTMAEALVDLPGGVAALAPRNGVIPVDPFSDVAPSVADAHRLLREADEALEGTSTSLVPDLIADPLLEFRVEVEEALGTVSAADRLTRVLPEFLGADAPKRYFVGAQNPAELRGTGGLIGAYTIMTIDEGRMELGSFEPVQDLPESDGVEPPNPDYAARYDRFGGPGYWLNINMTPDFPSAATAIERLYEETTGEALDGTIVADPEALARMMEGGGPVGVPGSNATVEPKTLVPFLTNEAYEIFTNPEERKRLLGDVAGVVLGRYLAGEAGNPISAGRALADAVGDGHLLLHSTEPEIQSAFEDAGVAGRLLNPPGDYLSVVVNNAGGNKVDFYLERSISHDVMLLEDGSAEVVTEIRFRNRAPSTGLVPYVIGPYPGVSDAGENVMFLSVYAANGARLLGAEENGEPGRGGLERELGHPVAWTNVRMDSGDSATLRFRWKLPQGWTGNSRAGTYRLTFQGQTTIRPTKLQVRVTPPPGMRVPGEEGFGIQRGAAVWTGTPGDLAVIRVRFIRPTAVRLVDDVLPGPLL